MSFTKYEPNVNPKAYPLVDAHLPNTILDTVLAGTHTYTPCSRMPTTCSSENGASQGVRPVIQYSTKHQWAYHPCPMHRW